ncbi:GyrI-like domain-containing protein [Motilibacter deserti]|uniref:GyrI-like domain-containing protein n=1 Tax=Motilibacter deserti TaxID=2714956 RepID=A0ABX0GRL9_9ACTN|nr:GyrI-like domain-containing protein [Motilibacter deserti]
MPYIVERGEQAYVGTARDVRMDTIGEIADRLPELLGRLAARDVPLAGAPFLRYLVFRADGTLRVEAGVPVPGPVDVGDGFYAGALPGGRYAASEHVGHFDGLADATERLLAWGEEQGLAWDRVAAADAEEWACRLESYETDPRQEPDPGRWRTGLLMRLA